MVDIAEQCYGKELNKVTYYMDEIKGNLASGVKEDLQLANEQICELNRTIQTAAKGVKDDLILIHELRSNLKEELVELKKQEANKHEEDWFKKKVELEMMLEKNEPNMKCPILGQ